jgi:hypothetical protein
VKRTKANAAKRTFEVVHERRVRRLFASRFVASVVGTAERIHDFDGLHDDQLFFGRFVGDTSTTTTTSVRVDLLEDVVVRSDVTFGRFASGQTWSDQGAELKRVERR